MITKHLMLLPYSIRAKGLDVAWHKNGQMWWYIESKDGKKHGNVKGWWSGGGLARHNVYKNGELVKEIV